MGCKVLRGALKLGVLTSVSLLALTAAAHAQEATGPVKPYYGNIRPFYGNLHPFYGNLHPFYGNLRPFYGNLRPFWGDVTPFWGDMKPFAATKDPTFWGTQSGYVDSTGKYDGAAVGAFWNTEGTKYQSILANWTAASTPDDYRAVADQLKGMVSDSSAFWGDEVARDTGGKSFSDGFANGLLGKYGIDLNDPNSLSSLDESDQAMFFLDWYDGLMSHAGAGHVDWWMGATGWSPSLSQTAGGAATSRPVTIGMVDFTVSPTGKSAPGTVLQYGSSAFGDGHGAAVGSLMIGAVDGSKIMGVMPAGAAKITAYDPYDSTGTTNWTDVGKGVDTLTGSFFNKSQGGLLDVVPGLLPTVNSLLSNGLGPLKIAVAGAPIGVLNASLGEPGWTLSPGWNGALASGSAKYSVLVVAAGNDGTVQPANVPWNFQTNPSLIVVGSVGLDGTISNFSNTPGEACLIDTASGQCDKLKNHFIVAPGELILVSDGQGGISRQTGTSLAAPLVTAAIGLLEARWPWLANHPEETADIILESATPIHSAGYSGTGPDPVYGWGELNIAASQQPLDWSKLSYLQTSKSLLGLPLTVPVSLNQVVAQVKTGNQSSWDSSKLSFTAYEKVGNTFRDFQIPMASSLVGQNVSTMAGQQLFQSYLKGDLQSWVAGGAHFMDSSGYAPATADFVASSQPGGRFGDSELRVRMSPAQAVYGFRQDNLPPDMDFALVGASNTMRFGFGDGAAALSGQPGLSGPADFQLGRGGADPLLGLASGGAYADVSLQPVKGLSVSFGATSRKSRRDRWIVGPTQIDSPAAVYGANAGRVGIDYAPSRRVVLHAALTRLREDTGLLGIQSLQPEALRNGSTTQAASVGADFALSSTLSVSASGTLARTRAADGQTLSTSSSGLVSTAAEIAVTKAKVLGRSDRLRLTLSKPLQVVSGQVQYLDYGVVDRDTGELGTIVRSADVAGGRTPLAAELFYGRMLQNDAAEASLFLRAGMNTQQFGAGDRTDYMVGYRYKLTF